MAKSKNQRLRAPALSGGKRIKSPDMDRSLNDPCIVFSLEKIVPGRYCFSSLDSSSKQNFAEAIYKRRALTWTQIAQAGRHGLGSEKIPRHQIRSSIPATVSDDCDHFLALRFSTFKPMVGLRQGAVFYVLWFDHDFTLYPH